MDKATHKALLEELSPEAFLDWERHPVTLLLREALNREVNRVQQGWLDGLYTAGLEHTGVMRGSARAAQDLCTLTYEDFSELVSE